MPASAPGRILVTGASGFVGGHLLPALRAAYPTAEIITPSFDIRDAEAVDLAVAAAAPDAIIHLAAIAAPMDAKRDPALAWQVNLLGTLALARAVLAHAPQAAFLFAGTADAYGASFRAGTPLDETAPLAPQNTYGATKAAADLALGAMAAEGLRAIRVRPFNHTGPGQTEAFVVPAFAAQVARIAAGQQAPVLETGDLSSYRDFLDVRDVCAAYTLAIAADLQPGIILNLASGQPRQIGTILNDLLAIAGTKADIKTDPAPAPPQRHPPQPPATPPWPAPRSAGPRSSPGSKPWPTCWPTTDPRIERTHVRTDPRPRPSHSHRRPGRRPASAPSCPWSSPCSTRVAPTRPWPPKTAPACAGPRSPTARPTARSAWAWAPAPSPSAPNNSPPSSPPSPMPPAARSSRSPAAC